MVVQKVTTWQGSNRGILEGTRAIRETTAYLGRAPFQALSAPLTQGAPLKDPRDVSPPGLRVWGEGLRVQAFHFSI